MLPVLSTLAPIWGPGDFEETVFTSGTPLPLPVLPVLHPNTFQIFWKKQQRAGPVSTTTLEHRDGQAARWLAIMTSTLPIIFILHCLKYHSNSSITYFPDVDMPVIINHCLVSSIWQTDASALTGKKRTTAKQTWAIHYTDKILTDLSLQTHWKFESLLRQQLVIPEDHGNDWKQEWLPVAGKVSRLLSVLILNLGGGFLAKFWKRESFLRGYSKFLEQHPTESKELAFQVKHSLCSSGLLLQISSFVPTFLYVDKTQFQARTHNTYTIENTEFMVIHD